MDSNQTCPKCGGVVAIAANFCPACGNLLKPSALATSFSKQLIIYLVSFFLPPFGLGWAMKYLRSADPRARTIGIVSILLTVLSLLLTFWIASSLMNSYSQILNNSLGY